jgi:Arc/MetJ family transcription regulator
MKTTIEITDSLLAEAREVAAREQASVRSLVEEGLRRVLDERRSRSEFRLRKASFEGKGLHPDAFTLDWDALRERSYEGRGDRSSR